MDRLLIFWRSPTLVIIQKVMIDSLALGVEEHQTQNVEVQFLNALFLAL